MVGVSGVRSLMFEFALRGAFQCRQVASSAVSRRIVCTQRELKGRGAVGDCSRGGANNNREMARERGEGNACWHLASNSRAFPLCSWTTYVGLKGKGRPR